MSDVTIAERRALAHRLTAGRHGREEGEPGVTLLVRDGMTVHSLLARKGASEDLRRIAAGLGVTWPGPGRFGTAERCAILWTGPDEWTVYAEPSGRTEGGRLVAAAADFCFAVDQSDARTVIEVAGPRARDALAKGAPIDLHPRVFTPGCAAVTTVAAIAAQIWLLDEAPIFRIAVPRSYAEGFWDWLFHSAAEFGVRVEVRPDDGTKFGGTGGPTA